MKRTRILLVDDNDLVLNMMRESLEHNDFEVVSASSVTEALSQIVKQDFDVLITDLHMPGPGDGFAVVTAMRHSQPNALTLVLSGFPDLQGAMAAILLQADEVLVKPIDVKQLAEHIRKRTHPELSVKPIKESIASILERDTSTTIRRWLLRVELVEELACMPLSDQERAQHIPEMMENIVERLRDIRTLEAIQSHSPAAIAHGQLRYRQGYTAPLIVQESRILQVSLFETIQRNLASVNFSMVMADVMLIADEVDSQLSQSIASFLEMAGQIAA
jgi:ActR/RegA family two-component response regulator